MDTRLGGLLIVIIALLFLWLYDTGRWSDIVTILRGAPASTPIVGFNTTPQSSSSSSSQTSNGILGQASQLCLLVPNACPYPYTPPVSPSSGSSSGGDNTLGTIGSIVTGLGSIFGF